MFFVVGDIAFKLFDPEGLVGLGHRGVFAVFMPVPEAAVDKNHRPPFANSEDFLRKEEKNRLRFYLGPR